MPNESPLSTSVPVEGFKYDGNTLEPCNPSVAAEIPLTVIANEIEIATLQCTPKQLDALTVGFLFSSGLIAKAEEVQALRIDEQRWVAHCDLSRTPDMDLLQKRVYTSGCGKGIMYADMVELSSRRPLQETGETFKAEQLNELSTWLNNASRQPGKARRGLHSSALSIDGGLPTQTVEDIGRHNAVDKVVGRGLMEGVDFSHTVLVSTGRTSSDILHKVRRAGIPVCASRGTPTHQAVLRACDLNITLVGRMKRKIFIVYSHEERIAC